MRARVLAALAATFVAASAAIADPLPPLDVRATPIAHFKTDSDETRFGALEFRGGLILSTRSSTFGSLSGLDFAPDGTLWSVADTGYWFSGRLQETDGRLTGITDTRYGGILLDDGKPPKDKYWSDAEGLRFTTRSGKPVALVSFEGVITVRVYPGPDYATVPTRMKLPAYVKNLPGSKGLESIAVAPQSGPLKGATVVIAERALDKAGNHRGFVLDGPRAGTFMIVRTGGYDISDATFLPDGDLVILERSFSFGDGFAIRIRRIAASAIRPGATADGPVLLEADGRYDIDNLEGITARLNASGETILDLVSDDNSNFLQRTILLQFALVSSGTPVPRPRPK